MTSGERIRDIGKRTAYGVGGLVLADVSYPIMTEGISNVLNNTLIKTGEFNSGKIVENIITTVKDGGYNLLHLIPHYDQLPGIVQTIPAGIETILGAALVSASVYLVADKALGFDLFSTPKSSNIK